LGDAPGVTPGAEPAGQDFLALLAQAEAQDGSPAAGGIVPVGTAAARGVAGPPAGLDGVDPADSLLAAVEMPGEAEASLAAAAPAVPLDTGGDMPAAPQPVAGSFAMPAQEDGLATEPDLPMQAAGGASVTQAQPWPASDEKLVVRRSSGPQAAAVPKDAPQGVQKEVQMDVQMDVSGGPAEEPGAAAASMPDTPSAPVSMLVSSPVLSPPLAEWRGLSMPPYSQMVGAGALAGQTGLGQASLPAATGVALPYQQLLPPRLFAQVAPAVLAMGFLPGADGGPARLTIAIRPAELGALQIVTERAEDGPARIAVFAERAETLQLLVRDAPTLETALREAGVDTGGGLTLTFGLAGQGRGDRGADARDGSGRPPGRGDGADPAPPVIPAAAMARTSLLDLSI
jgi:flagellar hook-length control protein FliK